MCPAPCSTTSAFVEADRSAVHTWDEELLFGQIDGLGSGFLRQEEPAGDAVAAAWMKEAKLELQLPATAQQVQATAQSLLHSQALLANNPHAFGQALASRLPSVQFVLRRANGKSAGQPASPPGAAPWTSLPHTFLLAMLPGAGEQFVVEPDFAAHFRLAGAGEVYNAVLGALPTPLVASPQQVHALVKKLQALMAAEAQQMGRSLAPWRNTAPLLSKFFPARFADTPVTPLHTLTAPTRPAMSPEAAGAAEEEDEPSSPFAISEASSSALTTPSGPSPDTVLPMSPGSLSLRLKPTSLAAAAAAVAATRPADVAVPIPPAVGLPVAATAGGAPDAPQHVVVGFNITTPLVRTSKDVPASTPAPTVAAASRTPGFTASPTPGSSSTLVSTTLVTPQPGGTIRAPGLFTPGVLPRQVAGAVKRSPAGLLASARQEELASVQPAPEVVPGPAAGWPAAYMALLPRCVTVKPCGAQPPAARAAAAIAAGHGRTMYVA